MNIVQLLSEASAQIGAVRKEGTAAFKSTRYNFRGVDAVVNAVAPAFRKCGIVVYPHVQDVDRSTVPSTSGVAMTSVRLIVDYIFVGPEGDSITATVAAESYDSGDKATAKAMSVAYRTALLQVLTLPTDEQDPDEQIYEQAANQVSGESVEKLIAECARKMDLLNLDADHRTKAVVWASRVGDPDLSHLDLAGATKLATFLSKTIAESTNE